jgi:excisionase family DNA binding protein
VQYYKEESEGVPMPRDLRVGEVARVFSVVPSTIHRWIEMGRIKVKKTLGGHRRISLEEVERLQKELSHETENEERFED